MAEGEEQKVCLHGVCSCQVEPGKTYCGTYCEQSGEVTNKVVDRDQSQEIICDCGHPGCTG